MICDSCSRHVDFKTHIDEIPMISEAPDIWGVWRGMVCWDCFMEWMDPRRPEGVKSPNKESIPSQIRAYVRRKHGFAPEEKSHDVARWQHVFHSRQEAVDFVTLNPDSGLGPEGPLTSTTK